MVKKPLFIPSAVVKKFAAPKYTKRCSNAVSKKPRNIKKAEKAATVVVAEPWKKALKYGRAQQEEAWQSAEVDALYKCAAADVRVPHPYGCFDGVLLMDLITDADGDVAPRLNDITMSEQQALSHHSQMMVYITKMLCTGIVHGDLSEFNVLVDENGPVIIDMPQAVDASANNNAEAMFARDVNNMTNYYSQFAPQLAATKYAKEIWALYEKGNLSPETELTGLFTEDTRITNVDSILDEIDAAYEEEQERLERISDAESID